MKRLMIAICMIGILSACKNKENVQTESDPTAVETTEITPDNTEVDTASVPPPIDNPEPGVEKSGSNEQIP